MLIVVGAALYGFALEGSALVSAGAGDGTYVLWALVSSPLSLVQMAGVAVDPWLIIANWTMIGLVAAIPSPRRRRGILLSILCAHHLGYVLVWIIPDYARWDRFLQGMGDLWFRVVIVDAVMLYLLGQLYLWTRLCQSSNAEPGVSTVEGVPLTTGLTRNVLDLTRGRPWLSAIVGLFIGVAFAVLGLVAAGGGHGTYAPLAICSAPLSLLGIEAALWGSPFLWACLGLALGIRRLRLRRLVISALLGCHYLSAATALFGRGFWDWRAFEACGATWLGSSVLVTTFIVYLAAQSVAWISLIGPPSSHQAQR